MKIEEINPGSFNDFANKHILKNFYQTREYGELMSHSDFQVMYIGAYKDEVLVAASLILYKSIGPNMKYGYAPRGFLVDYYDQNLFSMFTKKLKDFFFIKGFAFIKINPEITYSIIDFKNKSKTINKRNKGLINYMKTIGYEKLKDNIYFESVLPKYTPIIHLPDYDMNDLDPSMVEDMETYSKEGLKIITGGSKDITTFYSFVQNKKNKTEIYYKYFYDIFSKTNMVDLLLVEINYDTYAKYLQRKYIIEENKNSEINTQFNNNPNDMNYYKEKIESDKLLNEISSNIALANTRMSENVTKEILGGCFIVKHHGRVTIYITGQNNDFHGIDIKTFIFYKIIEEYKKAGYIYLDLYGITADFNDTNPYKSLNDFKLKFNPTTYEYVGEFDLIINKAFHSLLWSTNKIQKEFYKPSIKN